MCEWLSARLAEMKEQRDFWCAEVDRINEENARLRKAGAEQAAGYMTDIVKLERKLSTTEERGQTYDAGYDKGWDDGYRRGSQRAKEWKLMYEAQQRQLGRAEAVVEAAKAGPDPLHHMTDETLDRIIKNPLKMAAWVLRAVAVEQKATRDALRRYEEGR